MFLHVQYRDFLYIEDFINLLFKILNQKKEKERFLMLAQENHSQKIFKPGIKKIKKETSYGI